MHPSGGGELDRALLKGNGVLNVLGGIIILFGCVSESRITWIKRISFVYLGGNGVLMFEEGVLFFNGLLALFVIYKRDKAAPCLYDGLRAWHRSLNR